MQLALQELHFFAKEVRVMGTYAAHPYRKSNLRVED
jgi:prephenate dehydratase